MHRVFWCIQGEEGEGQVPFRRGKTWLGGFLDAADFGSFVTGAVKYSYYSNSNRHVTLVHSPQQLTT